MSEIVLKISNVSKSYASLEAVRDLSFSVQSSSCFGLLGPNGAGKSTMMNMIYGKCARNETDGGKIDVFGLDPAVDELAIKYFSGVVPQDNNLDEELNVEENLKIYSKFYDMPASVAKQRIESLLDFLELSEKKKSVIKELSGGMQRRLVIARALLNEPKLLILDEPTTGLDPQVRHLIWEKLRALKAKGTTLLITTHYMEEAFHLCDVVLIMNKGVKVMEGPPADLLQKNVEPYVLELTGAVTEDEFTEMNGKNPDIRGEKSLGSTRFYSRNFESLKQMSQNMEPGTFHIRQSNLEDVFLKATGRTLNEHQ